jgi:hypothetical protein
MPVLSFKIRGSKPVHWATVSTLRTPTLSGHTLPAIGVICVV